MVNFQLLLMLIELEKIDHEILENAKGKQYFKKRNSKEQH
jgi:hypothetical protein